VTDELDSDELDSDELEAAATDDGVGDVEPAPADTPEERGRSLRQAATLTAIVGIAFSILFVVSFLLMAGVPGGKSTDAEIIDYYSDGGRILPVVVGLYLMPFAGIAFLWFIVALRMWAAAAERRQSVLQSNLQLVSGILFVALFFVGSAATSVLAISLQFAEGTIDPVAARQFPLFGITMIVFFAMRMAAMFVFTTSALYRSAGILPRWFTLLGFAVGLFLLLATSLQPIVALVFPVWVLALSLFLLRKAREIPRDVRLPPQSGVGMLNPLGTYRRPPGRPRGG
jgi:hypothetical protein